MMEQPLVCSSATAGEEEPAGQHEHSRMLEPELKLPGWRLIAGGTAGLLAALLAVVALKLGAGPPAAPVRLPRQLHNAYGDSTTQDTRSL